MNLRDLELALLEALKNSKRLDSVAHILTAYENSNWKDYVKFSDESYVRNLVCRNDVFEIFIICWKSNQKSPIHNHAKNGCLMKVLDGALDQDMYSHDLQFLGTSTVHTSEVSYIHDDIGLHTIENKQPKSTSVSLHVYSPPRHKTLIYSDKN